MEIRSYKKYNKSRFNLFTKIAFTKILSTVELGAALYAMFFMEYPDFEKVPRGTPGGPPGYPRCTFLTYGQNGIKGLVHSCAKLGVNGYFNM